MSHNPDLDPSSFRLDGGPVAALLIHGFTGAPPEMRLIGDTLHQSGFTVYGPLLPGHGTQPEDCNRVRWQDWTESVSNALASLTEEHETVFVAGLSMGAALTLYLAAHHPELPGIVTYAPPIGIRDRRRFLRPVVPLLKHVVGALSKPEEVWLDPEAADRIWCYEVYPTGGGGELLALIDLVKGLLPQVGCPLLIIRSADDPTVTPEGAQFVYDQVSSTDKELVTLQDVGHVLTVDQGWEEVAELTYRFMIDRVPGGRIG